MAKNTGGWRDANVHLVWAFGVVVAFGIWNFSLKWGDQDSFVSAISLALGLSSLIVGVYAIFQGLISSHSITSSSAELRSAATQVLGAAERVQSASSSLSTKMENMPATFDNLGAKIDALQSFSPPPSNTESELSKTENTISISGSEFMQRLNNGGKLSVYLFLRSYDTAKSFFPKDIFSDNDKLMANFSIGFAACVKTTKIMDIQYAAGDQKFRTIGLGVLKKDDIVSAIEAAEKEHEGDFIRRVKAQIDAFFDGVEETSPKPSDGG